MWRRTTAAIHRLARPALWEHVDELCEFQWVARKYSQEIHDRRLTAVLRHAAACVPRYQRLAAEKNWAPAAISSGDLAEFPFASVAEVAADPGAYRATVADPGDWTARDVRGIRRNVIRYVYGRRRKEVREATLICSRLMAGWQPGEPFAVIRGPVTAMEPVGGAGRRLADGLLHGQLVVDVRGGDNGNLSQSVRRLERHRPRLLVGDAAGLEALGLHLGRRRGGHAVHPAAIVTTAETLDDGRRAALESVFGCPVYGRYGLPRLGVVAQECHLRQGLHVLDSRVHVELVDAAGAPCADHEPGEIVLTDFTNGVMPMIRYRTGLHGRLGLGSCWCLRTMPLLKISVDP